MYKAVLILCAQALFIHSALSQCSSRAAIADHNDIGYGLRAPCRLDRAYGLGAWDISGPGMEYSRTSGGGLAVSSGSAIAPIGLSIASENEYKGQLHSAGELPFVGTVGVEGVLPTTGAGAVNHHCGDGINAMVSNDIKSAHGVGYNGFLDRGVGFGLEAPAFGHRAGWARKSCGCGSY